MPNNPMTIRPRGLSFTAISKYTLLVTSSSDSKLSSAFTAMLLNKALPATSDDAIGANNLQVNKGKSE